MDRPDPVLPFGLNLSSEPDPRDDVRERALAALYSGDPLDVARAAFHGATWATKAQPQGEATFAWSVVIPVRGAHAQLRRCIEEVAASESWRDVEIVVVFPEEERVGVLSGAPGLIAQFIATPEPLGFAAACNRGFRASRGDRVLFLNSDAYVPRRWRAHFDIALDHVHAVGPCGTNVSGFQNYGAGHSQRRFLDCPSVADCPVPRLVGFCLAVRRQSFIHVGGWNEEYGVGNYDDDDLSLRLALLSKPGAPSLGWASACLVEHEGSASFKELPDAEATYARLMGENGEKFDRRWGWALPAIDRWWRTL